VPGCQRRRQAASRISCDVVAPAVARTDPPQELARSAGHTHLHVVGGDGLAHDMADALPGGQRQLLEALLRDGIDAGVDTVLVHVIQCMTNKQRTGSEVLEETS
jgi:hypothetical protein